MHVLVLRLGPIFFYRYIVPYDDRLSIKNETYPHSAPDGSLYRRCLPVNNIGHFEIDQNHVCGGIISVILMSKMAVYLPEGTAGI